MSITTQSLTGCARTQVRRADDPAAYAPAVSARAVILSGGNVASERLGELLASAAPIPRAVIVGT